MDSPTITFLQLRELPLPEVRELDALTGWVMWHGLVANESRP